MATTISTGADTGIATANLKHIEVYGTSLKVVWTYANGTTHTTTGTAGADAADFIANLLPYLAGQAQISYFPAL